ncbi:MAG: hypothetical protein ABIL09_23260 [Gemmatimonadota bacterium]
MHRFLLDSDGTNFFAHTMTLDVEASVAEAVAACPAEVTTYLLCPNGCGKFYHPTRVGEVYPPAERLLELHRRGIDPFGLLLRALAAAGKETFITYRMNDVHGADDPDAPGTAGFKKRHPGLIVDPEGARQGSGGWMAHCLDYAQPPVQEYILATIEELLELYGDTIAGLQLDWLRFPRHLSGSTPEEVWEKRQVLTDFTAAVRRALDRRRPGLLLSARVPTNLPGWRRLGVDAGEWARQGLVDFLVATPFLVTDFAMPLGELRTELDPTRVPLYADLEFGHATQMHCPESLRAAALGLFGSGADGIYVFNFPCWTEYLAARPYHWLPDLATEAAAAAKPLLFSVSHERHRIPGIDQPGQLPAVLRPGSPLRAFLWLPPRALPARRALVNVHSGGDLTLKVNGRPGAELPHLRRAEVFPEYVSPAGHPAPRPRDEDCRVYEVDPAALRPGDNELVLSSGAAGDLEIQKINLGLW